MAPLPVGGKMVPSELLAIIGLMVAAAAFCFYIGLRPLSATLQLLTSSEFGFQFGLIALTILVLFNLFGVALLYLARGLWRADKVARGLTFVLLGSVALTLLLERYKTTGMKWAIGISLVALAVLAFAPSLTRYFREGPDSALPTSIAIAVTLIKAWSGVVGIVGLSLLPEGTQIGKLFGIGVVMVALGAAGWWTAQAVLAHSQAGRLAATVGTGIYLILLVIAGRDYASVIAPFAVGLGILAFLWLPGESNAWFGTPPLRPADPNGYLGP
jgi:hypothetical protein